MIPYKLEPEMTYIAALKLKQAGLRARIKDNVNALSEENDYEQVAALQEEYKQLHKALTIVEEDIHEITQPSD